MPRRIFYGMFILWLIFGSALAGCQTTPPASNHTLHMAALDTLPAEVQSAPVTVQEAYQFAFANPEVLKAIPCYCGCGNMGHTSNYACYVSDEATNTYDSHALGCTLCIDITQDTMRLLKEGESVPNIRAYVDANYAKFGPSNMPE